jgi:hypothetical protein
MDIFKLLDTVKKLKAVQPKTKSNVKLGYELLETLELHNIKILLEYKCNCVTIVNYDITNKKFYGMYNIKLNIPNSEYKLDYEHTSNMYFNKYNDALFNILILAVDEIKNFYGKIE